MKTVMSGAEMLALLRRWADQGWLRELDCAFAAFLLDRAPQAPALLIGHSLGGAAVLAASWPWAI